MYVQYHTIPPEAWTSLLYECCVLSCRGLCDRPIARPEESYRVCLSVCVCVGGGGWCVTHRDVTGFHVHTKHDDKYSFELCEFKSFAALVCWDCGFESRRRHECLVSGECCVLSLLRADPSSRGVLPSVCVSMGVIRRNNDRQQQTEEVRLRRKQGNTNLTFSRIRPCVVFY